MTRRSRAREVALQLLFQRDSNPAVDRAAVEQFVHDRLRDPELERFCLALYDGTTGHLAARLADEARALLRHSNWTLAEIGYCLGFEHPANFAAFFKQQVGQPPQAYRRQAAASATVIG